MEKTERFYSERAAASQIGLDVKTIRKYRRKGVLVADGRVGRTLIFRQSTLDTLSKRLTPVAQLFKTRLSGE